MQSEGCTIKCYYLAELLHKFPVCREESALHLLLPFTTLMLVLLIALCSTLVLLRDLLLQAQSHFDYKTASLVHTAGHILPSSAGGLHETLWGSHATKCWWAAKSLKNYMANKAFPTKHSLPEFEQPHGWHCMTLLRREEPTLATTSQQYQITGTNRWHTDRFKGGLDIETRTST